MKGIALAVVLGVVAGGSAIAQRPMIFVDNAAANTSRMRAAALGIHLAAVLADVPLPAGPATTAQNIRDAATKTRTNLDQTLQRTRRTQTWLGVPVFLGNTVVEVGQWAGGAGAAYFGLQAGSADTQTESKNQGRNAFYSGAVSFGVTLVKDVFHLDDAKKQRDACATLGGSEFGLVQQTFAWEAQADDPNYQQSFFSPSGTFDKFNATVDQFVKDCLS